MYETLEKGTQRGKPQTKEKKREFQTDLKNNNKSRKQSRKAASVCVCVCVKECGRMSEGRRNEAAKEGKSDRKCRSDGRTKSANKVKRRKTKTGSGDSGQVSMQRSNPSDEQTKTEKQKKSEKCKKEAKKGKRFRLILCCISQ